MGSSKGRFIPLSYQFRKDQQRVMNNPLLWQSGVDVYERTDCFLLQEADGNGDGWATSVQQGCEHQASLDSVDEVHPSVRTAQGFCKLTSLMWDASGAKALTASGYSSEMSPQQPSDAFTWIVMGSLSSLVTHVQKSADREKKTFS